MSTFYNLPRPHPVISVLATLTLIVTLYYLAVRAALFFETDYYWYEKAIAMALLLAETFIVIHGMGYFLNVLRVSSGHKGRSAIPEELPPLEQYPPVAIVVAAYREPLDVIRDNLICFRNLTYPNKFIYLLDDTRYDLPKNDPEEIRQYRTAVESLCSEIGVNLFRRRWHGAKAGILNDFLAFMEGRPPEGYEFSDFQGKQRLEKEKYYIVFDADMNPLPDFVEPLIQIMEANPKIAFVQTPQYYTNFEFNRVARAAGVQQAIFYEYICEGKSSQDAMFCCGTNVVFRREALSAVGGLDESSVTEDFATSLKFHMAGWSSAYLNRICAFGMGPQDLAGYFKQQFRWALGTVGLFRVMLAWLVRSPRSLARSKWTEYLLSGTHYFVGWVYLIFYICPIIYLFFGVPRYFAYPSVFLIVFFPYIVLTFFVFNFAMGQRAYRVREIVMGLLLTAISFPVYIKASAQAMLGVKGSFDITPKKGSTILPLGSLWPQLGMASLAFASVVWGVNSLVYIRQPVSALVINMFWSLYNFMILSTVIYFNYAEEHEA